MPTTFTSLRTAGALTVGGLLTAGVVAAAAISGTTGTFTGTVTAPTFTNSSGSFLINNTGVDATTKRVEAATLSGATIRNTAGDISIDSTDFEFTTASGATFRTTAGSVKISDALGMSGASLTISPSAAAKNRILCAGTGGLIGRCTSNTAADCGCVVF